MLYNKGGAMFGLDARIALAIFGALSVISGAALYSAIQQSKIVAITTELNEINKAYEAYILDTGQDLTLSGSSLQYAKTQELIDNSENVSGWNGPYLSYEPSGSAYLGLNHPTLDEIRVAHMHDETWGSNSLGTCAAGKACYAWAMIKMIPHELAKALDIYIDGEYNKSEGNFRIHDTNGTATSAHVYLKGHLILKQP